MPQPFRLNSRPQSLRKNPSGLVVAGIAAGVGVIGGIAYLAHRMKSAASGFTADFQAALRTGYGVDNSVLRLMPGGSIQYLHIEKGETNGSWKVTSAQTLPLAASQGAVVAEVIKASSSKPAQAPVIVDLGSYAKYETPGALTIMEVSRTGAKAAVSKLPADKKAAWDTFVAAVEPLNAAQKERMHKAARSKA